MLETVLQPEHANAMTNVLKYSRIRLSAFIALIAITFWSGACTSEQSVREVARQGRDDTESAPAAAQGSIAQATGPADSARVELSAFEVLVPGTTVKLDMRPVPRGTLEVDDPARPGQKMPLEIGAFWMASTETTWDMYDAFVFALDRAETERDPPDAWTRPSKPYILMDRGFGRAGYPVISVSAKGATEFCKWLSVRTGLCFRLPTEFEWERACRGVSSATILSESRGGASSQAPAVAVLGDVAWFRDNSELDQRLTTHPVAGKKPNSLGLFDMFGNAAEWTTSGVGPNGTLLCVARGGSFRDTIDDVSATARRPNDKSLNKTDPQLPRSVWWLADGGFIGFRVLCEPRPAR